MRRYTEKTVSLNQKNISLICDQRKNFFEFKKVLLVQKKFFNVNKSISLDQRKFLWINKSFFNPKKLFLWPYIKEIFLWFKETVFSVYWFYMKIHFRNFHQIFTFWDHRTKIVEIGAFFVFLKKSKIPIVVSDSDNKSLLCNYPIKIFRLN